MRRTIQFSNIAHKILSDASDRLGISMGKLSDKVIEKALKEKNLRVTDASRIFRAMQGDKDAQQLTTIDEVSGYLHAEDFYSFLQINNINLIEGEQ